MALEDLSAGYSLGQVAHDSKIDWLELNDTGVCKITRQESKKKPLLLDQRFIKYACYVNNLSETFFPAGRKLLFRDKRSRLNLVDVETLEKTSVLNYCTFVQWVPSSDVVVAQSRDNMAVWYNIDAASERVTLVRNFLISLLYQVKLKS